MGKPLNELVRGDVARGLQIDDKEAESPNDHILALAYTSALGTAVTRLAADEGRIHLEKALQALASASRQDNHHARNHPAGEIEALVKIALLEWMRPACGRCKGRGFVPSWKTSKDSHRIECPKCAGTGKHRYSYGDRSKAFGRRLTEIQEKRIDDALALLEYHDRLVSRVIRSRLRE